jgi:squalene cyclase
LLASSEVRSLRSKQDLWLATIQAVQTHDGGWGPYGDAPPEVFDTALVLLALAEIRDKSVTSELIERGRKFLITEQNPDGSWAATTRPRGSQSYAQLISTTAWAAMALMSTEPPATPGVSAGLSDR